VDLELYLQLERVIRQIMYQQNHPYVHFGFVQSSTFGSQGKIIVTASSIYGNANVTLMAV
jgi:hypothetical protein